MARVNRKDLQTLGNLRLREARALAGAAEFSGAYYLAGYAVECGLKACIAKAVKRHDFPERQQRGNDPYIHDLVQLLALAGLKDAMRLHADADVVFQKNWDVTILWNEQSRYRIFGPQETRRLINAIIETRHGVMPWLKQRW
jgi:hypothetical protein